MNKTSQHEPPLLFDWHRRERTFSWLLISMLLTGLGFAVLFILFRIVTPETPKLTSRPQQMIVLNPDVPAERALINRAMDLSFTLLPSESPSLREVPKAAKLPDFRTSLSSFDLKLKALDLGLTTRVRPRLFAQDIDILPPLPVLEPPVIKPAQKSTLRLHIDGELSGKLVSDTALPNIALIDPARPAFDIAVGPMGQVIMALPIAASEEPVIMVKLHAAMTQLRFQPTGKDIVWGQVHFAWEKEAAP
jgi:hypothetical protein